MSEEMYSESMEDYLKWVADCVGTEFSERIKKSIPKLIESGMTTPDEFRGKFNKGSLEFPETEKVLRALRKFEKL